MWRKYLKFGFAVFVIVQIVYHKLLQEYVDKNDNTKVDKKIVLFWTNFFDETYWKMSQETYREENLKSIGCPVTNCIFTHDRKFLSHPHEYDALIFHAARAWDEPGDELPATRSSHQVYIMALLECPGTSHNLSLRHNFFNLTMTYRLDSDIGWYYGKATELATNKVVAPSMNVQWREPDDDDFILKDGDVLNLINGKNKTAAWFVSNCNTFSRREDLVREMQKFIDVDVYGGCGPLTCPRSSSTCHEKLSTTYRFYLSFENTLCIDYVTEKLYNALNEYVIPVIYSGAELSRFLPRRSYIDANEFETVEDLTNYLKFLSEHPEEYVKYFWWKKYYKFIRNDDVELCELCQKLNEPNFSSKVQIYTNVEHWYFNNACKDPRIKF